MQRKFTLLLLLLLISDDVFGKNSNKSKLIKAVHKHYDDNNNKVSTARIKRSLDDDDEKILYGLKNVDINDDSIPIANIKPGIEKESPFWGARGRRESISDETVPDVQLPTSKHQKYFEKTNNLNQLIMNAYKPLKTINGFPFWGHRGRRYSDYSKDTAPGDLFWAPRGKRQDDEPFWGTRGRREEDSPFWGNRGRRESASFKNFPKAYDGDDSDEPFWGNRGRRYESKPFWGNRQRSESLKNLWGTHGENKVLPFLSISKPIVGIRDNTGLKNCIVDAINYINRDSDKIATNKRNDIQNSYWFNNNRVSKIKSLLNSIAKNCLHYIPDTSNDFPSNQLRSKLTTQNTVHDDRIYAEEPHYILVERDSRSSGEDDPFYITRGKKYKDIELVKEIRERRGALEEIVKSVRNDPYYIARGKKDDTEIGNSTTMEDQILKTKDLVCSTIGLLKKPSYKVKRMAKENERDRRTTLKKLALQLQMDPYFVSRGKKNDVYLINSEDLVNFLNKIIHLCN